jgi:hypothetical protein
MLLMKVKERGHIYLIDDWWSLQHFSAICVVVVGVDPLVMSEIATDN